MIVSPTVRKLIDTIKDSKPEVEVRFNLTSFGDPMTIYHRLYTYLKGKKYSCTNSTYTNVIYKNNFRRANGVLQHKDIIFSKRNDRYFHLLDVSYETIIEMDIDLIEVTRRHIKRSSFIISGCVVDISIVNDDKVEVEVETKSYDIDEFQSVINKILGKIQDSAIVMNKIEYMSTKEYIRQYISEGNEYFFVRNGKVYLTNGLKLSKIDADIGVDDVIYEGHTTTTNVGRLCFNVTRSSMGKMISYRSDWFDLKY